MDFLHPLNYMATFGGHTQWFSEALLAPPVLGTKHQTWASLHPSMSFSSLSSLPELAGAGSPVLRARGLLLVATTQSHSSVTVLGLCCWLGLFLPQPVRKPERMWLGQLKLIPEASWQMARLHGYHKVESTPAHRGCHSRTLSAHPRGTCSTAVACCCLFHLH